jgi:hypothetical protein
MKRNFGTRIGDLEITEEQLDERQNEQELNFYKKPRRDALWKPIIIVNERLIEATILVQGIVERFGRTTEGELIHAVARSRIHARA